MSKTKHIVAFAAFLVIAFLPGIAGSAAVGGMRGFYAEIARPAWSPPAWVFGPVWMVLYTMIGIAGYMSWRGLLRPGDHALTPLGRAPDAFGLFVVQLLINGLWTPVFFGLQSFLGGAIIIVFLWLAIVGNVLLFWRIDSRAALLLVPYLAWVTFAGVLNGSIWRLN